MAFQGLHGNPQFAQQLRQLPIDLHRMLGPMLASYDGCIAELTAQQSADREVGIRRPTALKIVRLYSYYLLPCNVALLRGADALKGQAWQAVLAAQRELQGMQAAVKQVLDENDTLRRELKDATAKLLECATQSERGELGVNNGTVCPPQS